MDRLSLNWWYSVANLLNMISNLRHNVKDVPRLVRSQYGQCDRKNNKYRLTYTGPQ